MNLKKIEDISPEQISEITSSPPVLFIGSAISLFPPTKILSGMTFCDKMFEYIFSERTCSSSDLLWFKKEFDEMPFEALMECYPNTKELPVILKNIYQSKKYNLFHKKIAELLLSNRISAIISTNYDLAFDELLKSEPNIIVRNEFDYKKWVENDYQKAYFKIHGTAEDGYESTLVYSLIQEGHLPAWKEDLIKRLITDKILVFIGYSGRDFDICPFISNLNSYKKIIWIHCNPCNESLQGMAAYARVLVKKQKYNEVLLGDLGKFISFFFKIDISLKLENIDFDPNNFFYLTKEAHYKWQLNIFNRTGCSVLAKSLIDKIDNEKERQDYLFHFYQNTGEYAKALTAIKKLFFMSPINSKERIINALQLSESFLYYGNHLKALKYLYLSKKESQRLFPDDEQISISLVNSEICYLMRLYQIFSTIRFGFILPILQKSIKTLELLHQKQINTTGLMAQKQRVRQYFDRISLNIHTPFEISYYDEYLNLGLPFMAAVAYRDKIRYNKWDSDEIPFDKLDEFISRIEQLGCYTELWKLCRIKIKYCQIDSTEAKVLYRKWVENFKVTEYNFFVKILFRLDMMREYIILSHKN